MIQMGWWSYFLIWCLTFAKNSRYFFGNKKRMWSVKRSVNGFLQEDPVLAKNKKTHPITYSKHAPLQNGRWIRKYHKLWYHTLFAPFPNTNTRRARWVKCPETAKCKSWVPPKGSPTFLPSAEVTHLTLSDGEPWPYDEMVLFFRWSFMRKFVDGRYWRQTWLLINWFIVLLCKWFSRLLFFMHQGFQIEVDATKVRETSPKQTCLHGTISGYQRHTFRRTAVALKIFFARYRTQFRVLICIVVKAVTFSEMDKQNLRLAYFNNRVLRSLDEDFEDFAHSPTALGFSLE